jgi:hypothetical protein
MRYILFTVAVLIMFSCKKAAKPEPPTTCVTSCIQLQIDNALSKPKGSLFYKIDAYTYNRATVYLYYMGCCDRFNELKDGNCKYLFSPSGGFSGGGDGTHPTFFTDAKFVAVVWEDPRQ